MTNTLVSTLNQKLKRTKILHGRDRMNMIDEFGLCDDGNFLSNNYKLPKIVKLLGVEAKTCNEVPNKGWDMADR